MTISSGVGRQCRDRTGFLEETIRSRDFLISGRLTSCSEPSTIFVRRVLVRLTSFDESLTIHSFQFLMKTWWSGYDDFFWCREDIQSPLEASRLFDVLFSGGLASIGEPSIIFVFFKPSASRRHGLRQIFIVRSGVSARINTFGKQ